MTIEPPDNKQVVQKRIQGFLKRDSRGQSPLNQLFNKLGTLGPTVIFGGMPRDICLVGSRGFAPGYSSDVDIVVATRAQELEQALDVWVSQRMRNTFGGHRMSCGEWIVDVWALESTWAIRNGYVQVGDRGIDALLDTTFFNWDAWIYKVNTRSLYMQRGVLDKMRDRILGINLQHNPRPVGVVVRTLRWLLRGDVRLDPRLARFLHSQLAGQAISETSLEKVDAFPGVPQRWLLTGCFVQQVVRELDEYIQRNVTTPFELSDISFAVRTSRPRKLRNASQSLVVPSTQLVLPGISSGAVLDDGSIGEISLVE